MIQKLKRACQDVKNVVEKKYVLLIPFNTSPSEESSPRLDVVHNQPRLRFPETRTSTQLRQPLRFTKGSNERDSESRCPEGCEKRGKRKATKGQFSRDSFSPSTNPQFWEEREDGSFPLLDSLKRSPPCLLSGAAVKSRRDRDAPTHMTDYSIIIMSNSLTISQSFVLPHAVACCRFNPHAPVRRDFCRMPYVR